VVGRQDGGLDCHRGWSVMDGCSRVAVGEVPARSALEERGGGRVERERAERAEYEEQAQLEGRVEERVEKREEALRLEVVVAAERLSSEVEAVGRMPLVAVVASMGMGDSLASTAKANVRGEASHHPADMDCSVRAVSPLGSVAKADLGTSEEIVRIVEELQDDQAVVGCREKRT
jgi:hypothetical protein